MKCWDGFVVVWLVEILFQRFKCMFCIKLWIKELRVKEWVFIVTGSVLVF